MVVEGGWGGSNGCSGGEVGQTVSCDGCVQQQVHGGIAIEGVSPITSYLSNCQQARAADSK